MNCKKTVLAELEKPYAVRAVEIEGRSCLFVASEERDGKCLLFEPPDYQPSLVWDGTGGCMSIVQVPGREKAFVAVQECYPIFQSKNACLVYARAGDNITDLWQVSRVVELPYAHRCEVVQVGGQPYVVAATLCSSKDFQDDWSTAGSVYVARIPEDPADGWSLKPVLEGVTKNHGMRLGYINGAESILISGHEGLYQIKVPGEAAGKWQVEHLIDHEISDIYPGDLDGDGSAEIVAIEPFHGDGLVVYKLLGGRWEPVYETAVNFGHVVWAGDIQGRAAIIAGSRAEDKELVLLRPRSNDLKEMERLVIDTQVGSSQITVVKQGSRDLIVSANNGAGEVVLYEIG